MLDMLGDTMETTRSSACLLAACAALAWTAASCKRTTLVTMRPDSASSSAEDAAAVDTEMAGEVAAESGWDVSLDLPREAGSEGGAEATPDLPGDVARDAGLDIASHTDAETSHDGGSSRCTAWESVTTLARLDGQPLPAALVVRDDSVFVGTLTGTTGSVTPNGSIVAVSLSTGKTTTFPLGETLPNQMVSGPDALFYIQGKPVKTTDGWRFEYPDVARLDLATGKVSVVDSALVPVVPPIWSVVGTASGEIFWSMLTDVNGSSIIKRWDAATGSGQSVFAWDRPLLLFVDRDHFYWAGRTSSGYVGFWSVPSAGGSASQIYQSTSGNAEGPSLAGVDEEDLYYSYPGSSTLRGIFAMPKQGGDARVVVPDAVPILMNSRTIDETHVYWVDQYAQSSIRRAPKRGNGTIESIPVGSSGTPSDLVVDGCAIYWAGTGPYQLLVRAK